MKKYPHILYAVTIAALSLAGCHSSDSHPHEETDSHHDHDEDEIIMSPEDAARFGVTVEEAAVDTFSSTVKVLGEIISSSSDQSVVSAPTSGVVHLAKGTEIGEHVSAGNLIATISASGIAGGDRNKADKAALDAAKRELDRVTPLLKDGIVTKKEYNDALSAYEAAKSSFSPSAASGRAVAAGSGIITALMVSDGAFVEAGDPIAMVSNNTRLTLKALLPAKEINFLPLIVSANIVTDRNAPAVDILERGAKLLSSSASAAATSTGYIPVYFTFDNYGDIAPGSPAEVYLVGKERSQILTVPVSSISEQLGEMFVYVKTEDHAYSKHNVTLGRSDGRRVEVLSGLNPGDSVVTAGTTFVRLAETSTVVPEGHSHHH